MSNPLRVLIVDDSPTDTDLLIHELRRGGYEPTHRRVETAEAMTVALDREPWDLVFCDQGLPHFDAFSALRVLRGTGLDIPFLLVAGTGDEDAAVAVMQAGANDYIMKGNVKRLLPAVERELRERDGRRAYARADAQRQHSDERLQIAISAARMYTWDWDVRTGQVIRSGLHQDVYGVDVSATESTYDAFLTMIHRDDRENVHTALNRALQGTATCHVVFRIVRSNGEIRWLEAHGQVHRDSAGEAVRMIGVTQDITERTWAEQTLHEHERVLATLMSNLPGMVYRCRNDKDWTVEFVSEGCYRLTGYHPADLRGNHRVSYGQDVIHPDNREAVWKDVQAALREQRRFELVYRIVTADKAEKWVWEQGQGIFSETGDLLALEGFITDITERKRAQDTIQHMAFYDQLTGLPNRTNLYDRLTHAIRISGGNDTSMAVLLMNLNRFNEINDTLGHDRGDQLLQQVGRRLREVIFDRDIVARLGANEFAVLLFNTANAMAIDGVIQKIVTALDTPFVIMDLPIMIETSIGIALYPTHGTEAGLLFQRAGIAMNLSKQTGIPYTLYNPAQDQLSPQRLALMGELHHAIEHDELVLFYQPKIDLKTHRIVGAEALVRWQHPYRGSIYPDQFILPAERTGMIHSLTRWVMAAGMRQCAAWHTAGRALTVSINLSARNLLDAKLPGQVAELFRTTGVSPEWVTFEITESAIMADPTHALETLDTLHKMGIRLSIDDFGTGYTSLSYLRRLPLNRLKVDKSFVIQMIQSESDAMIVRSTIDLAHNLHLEVVAEGVENQETYDRLVEWGCDAAQGYYMSHPLSAAEFTRWLTESPWGLPSVSPKAA